ncbi:MAG: universal stress protein [Spirochaetales bacterium]|nr:universal stress protein [Spirochaetales bacterium]
MSGPINKILVYVDGSEESVSASMYAIALAKTTGAAITAVYVVNTRALQDLVKARIFLEVEQEEYHRDLDADAERYLNHVQKLADQKVVPLKTVKVSGTVHREIKNMIKEDEFDLLVLGGIGQIRSRRDEFLNESERAMRSAPCPVIVVKDEDRVWDMFESLK